MGGESTDRTSCVACHALTPCTAAWVGPTLWLWLGLLRRRGSNLYNVGDEREIFLGLLFINFTFPELTSIPEKARK